MNKKIKKRRQNDDPRTDPKKWKASKAQRILSVSCEMRWIEDTQVKVAVLHHAYPHKHHAAAHNHYFFRHNTIPPTKTWRGITWRPLGEQATLFQGHAVLQECYSRCSVLGSRRIQTISFPKHHTPPRQQNSADLPEMHRQLRCRFPAAAAVFAARVPTKTVSTATQALCASRNQQAYFPPPKNTMK